MMALSNLQRLLWGLAASMRAKHVAKGREAVPQQALHAIRGCQGCPSKTVTGRRPVPLGQPLAASLGAMTQPTSLAVSGEYPDLEYSSTGP